MGFATHELRIKAVIEDTVGNRFMIRTGKIQLVSNWEVVHALTGLEKN